MTYNLKDFEHFSNWEELEHVSELLANWLGCYTEEVIERVMQRADEILADETTINFLEELLERETKERKERQESIEYIIRGLADDDSESVKLHIDNFHNHCLTHSKSYRDVLYDLYIK